MRHDAEARVVRAALTLRRAILSRIGSREPTDDDLAVATSFAAYAPPGVATVVSRRRRRLALER